MTDRDLRRALEAVDVPEAKGASERAAAAVGAAFAARRPRQGRNRILLGRPAPALALLLSLLFVMALAATATQPGAAVRTFVVRALGVEPQPAPRARIGPLPKGRMLVTSPRGAWIVAPDGSRRLLGSYTGASWSPHGLYVVAWRGDELRAVAPDGRVAWGLQVPGRVADARWSPDGFRIAYRRGDGIGVVAGDGTAPRALATRVAPAGPAWRPGDPHTLAWVDASGRPTVRDVDTGALVWRAPKPVEAARSLAWSADGRLLLVGTNDGLRLADVRANRVQRVLLPRGDRAVAAAWAPSGRRLAVVARQPSRDLSRVFVAADGVRLRPRALFVTTGRLGSPAWSPDGRRVLVRWAEADQWLLLPASRRASAVVAISPVAPRFGGTPVVRGWCCS